MTFTNFEKTMKLTLAGLSALAVLAACSSQPEQPPVISESFITNISDDGIRFFTYEVTLNTRAGKPPNKRRAAIPRDGEGRERAGRRGANGGRGDLQQMREKMRANADNAIIERLEKHLETTGYCAAGYLVLDKNIDPNRGYIRGECK